MINLDDTSYDKLEYAINQYILGKHGERDREIMRLHLITGLTAEEIAEIKDLSARQVFRIFAKRESQLIGKI